MTRHTLLDQVLHRFALDSKRFRKFCFNRECERNRLDFDRHRENVFIAGVARSGSTALLNALYASGAFASTTYGLMPFVMAPSLSRVIARIPVKQAGASERMHGDSIRIDLDSAEALDGVFWDTYLPAGSRYLEPREVPPQVLRRYAMFIENILLHSARQRYLSKMNQGIDRVASLACFFERSTFLVPFRQPLQQATSLLRQHHNFSSLTAYEKKYFTWLEHHEFGATHLGFFETPSASSPAHVTASINYWLEQWQNGYDYLLRLAGLHPNIVPLCYEQMTASPSFSKALSRRLNIDLAGEHFINRNSADLEALEEADQSLLDACQSVYERLFERAGSLAC